MANAINDLKNNNGILKEKTQNIKDNNTVVVELDKNNTTEYVNVEKITLEETQKDEKTHDLVHLLSVLRSYIMKYGENPFDNYAYREILIQNAIQKYVDKSFCRLKGRCGADASSSSCLNQEIKTGKISKLFDKKGQLLKSASGSIQFDPRAYSTQLCYNEFCDKVRTLDGFVVGIFCKLTYPLVILFIQGKTNCNYVFENLVLPKVKEKLDCVAKANKQKSHLGITINNVMSSILHLTDFPEPDSIKILLAKNQSYTDFNVSSLLSFENYENILSKIYH